MTGGRLVVAVYSLAYDPVLLRALPYARSFVERGLCHLAELRRPDSRVVLVLPQPVAPDVLEYHLETWLGLPPELARTARSRLDQVIPEPRPGLSLVEQLLEAPDLVDRLRRAVRQASSARLVPAAPSPGVDALGRLLSLAPEDGPSDLCARWGSKAGGKRVLQQAGVDCPRGEPLAYRSADELTAAALGLARGGATTLVVKLDSPAWSAGLGNLLVDSRRLLAGGDLHRAHRQARLPWDRVAEQIAASGALVEEYLEETVASPSGQGRIGRWGQVRVCATHDQLIEGGHYLGGIYPCRPDYRDGVIESVWRVGRCLAGHGVRGHFGVDFVATAAGRLVATEVNVRKVAPAHVIAYVEAALRRTLSPAPEGEEGLAYVHRRVHDPDLLGVPPAKAIAELARRGLLWDARRESGALLHMLGGLQPFGYLETTSIAGSEAAARTADGRTREALAELGAG